MNNLSFRRRNIFFGVILFLVVSFEVSAETIVGIPAKLISTCQADLNRDKTTDLAIYVETMNGPELVILLAIESGYRAYTFSIKESNLVMLCVFSKSVEVIRFDDRKKKVSININGIFVNLFQPEGASVIYFWDGKSIKEEWLSD